LGMTTGGDPWSNDDSRWFAAHPTRRWRLRAMWPGELAATQFDAGADLLPDSEAEQRGAEPAVAVYQHEPGKRQRITVWLATTDPLDSFTDAGIERMTPGLTDRVRQMAARDDAEVEAEHTEKLKRRMRLMASRVESAP
jgi:hypothetical protein